MIIERQDTVVWEFDFKELRDKFPEDYAMARSDGMTDQDFVEETWYDLGEKKFTELFGEPKTYEGEDIEIIT